MRDGSGAILYDETGSIPVEVTSDGRLEVAISPPKAPQGTTPVKRMVSGEMSASTDDEDVYVISNTETLTIQRLAGGGRFNGDW